MDRTRDLDEVDGDLARARDLDRVNEVWPEPEIWIEST